MYDQELVCDILGQLQMAVQRILRRFQGVQTPEDFLRSDEGLDRLDAIGMMLIAIGESLKSLDRITKGELLKQYPQVDWKGAMGTRDVLSHHYFDLDAGIVFDICQNRIPTLRDTIGQMRQYLACDEFQEQVSD